MAQQICIAGYSGAGKSVSLLPNKEFGIKGLDPKKTVFINVANKPLPAKGWRKYYDESGDIREKGNYIVATNATKIKSIIEYVAASRLDVNHIVIDDMGFVLSFDVMNKVDEKGYDKWTNLAKSLYDLTKIARSVRNDLYIIFTFHIESNDTGKTKIKTAGKLIDNTVNLDGLFTYILYAETIMDPITDEVRHVFRTKTNGTDSCKTPPGCFEEKYIPNDIGYVIEQIEKYEN